MPTSRHKDTVHSRNSRVYSRTKQPALLMKKLISEKQNKMLKKHHWFWRSKKLLQSSFPPCPDLNIELFISASAIAPSLDSIYWTLQQTLLLAHFITISITISFQVETCFQLSCWSIRFKQSKQLVNKKLCLSILWVKKCLFFFASSLFFPFFFFF